MTERTQLLQQRLRELRSRQDPHEQHRTADEDEDNLRPRVQATLHLRGPQAEDPRAAANRAAIGGMRKPRISKRRNPKQLVVGIEGGKCPGYGIT